MRAYQRPEERFLDVERQVVKGTCPGCGSHDVKAYPVLSDGGWWDVRKCQSCLVSLSRERGPRFGSIEPLTALLPTSRTAGRSSDGGR